MSCSFAFGVYQKLSVLNKVVHSQFSDSENVYVHESPRHIHLYIHKTYTSYVVVNFVLE